MNIVNTIFETRAYGVIRSEDGERAVDIAKAMVKGGIKVLEINANNDECLADIIKETLKLDVEVVAGGIITSKQALNAIEAGAKMIASPILQTGLTKLSKWHQIPLIFAASTANEAYTAWKARIPLIKIYPIEEMGGLKYMEDLLRPMPFLNLMPTGSVALSDAKKYIDAGAKAVAIGREIYKDSSFDEIVEKSHQLVQNLA